MKKMKRLLCLLMMALLSFGLLAGCGKSNNSDNKDNKDNKDNSGSLGREFRDTDVIDDYCIVHRDGMEFNVCICHDRKAIYIYYDDEDHELFDIAKLPTDDFYDYDKDWLLGRISFSDFTGDGNDDLEVYIEHSDMSESYIVWTWEEDTGYVYQPDDSWFYKTIVIYDPPTDDTVDFSVFEGVWLGDEDNLYDDIYIEFDGEGNWYLSLAGETVDEGYLVYDSIEDSIYAEGTQDSVIDGGQVEMGGEWIYVSGLGYFDHLVSEDDTDDSEINDYGADSELYQRDISEFAGVWYYDNDLSAETYIIIDEYGNWSYFQRVPGDAEGTEIDYGTISHSADEVSTYYADSAMYDGVQYRMFDFDEGIIIWDEDTYYRME